MGSVNVYCLHCNSALIYRHGKKPAGHEHFRCHECHCAFQLTYSYQARKPGVKDQNVDMAFNGAGVRDTARTLKIGINTVIRTLKNSRQGEVFTCRIILM